MRLQCNNEKGIALITTLILMVLGFAVVATLLSLVTTSTKLAGLEQRYATTLDAAKGGADLIIQMINQDSPTAPIVRVNGVDTPIAGATNVSEQQCLKWKMTHATTDWDAAHCSDLAAAKAPFPTAIDPDQYNADLEFGLSTYNVYLKIIDTTGTDPVACASPPCPCENGCWFYTVNVRAQVPHGHEHADIDFVYRIDK